MTEQATIEQEAAEGPLVVEGGISLVGRDITCMPPEIGQQYGPEVKHLDLSYNSIIKIENIDRFVNLTTLVVDNNQLESDQTFPFLDKLRTLSVNNNNITDLRMFIDNIKDKFPQLTYMSMIKNPACPNEITGRDSDDYQRYRLYVLYRLKDLRFLDSSPVTEEEKREALRVGHLSLPARPDPAQYRRAVPATSPEDVYSTLPQELKQEGVGRASFGVSSYVYYGRQSEGNRFIMNDDL